MTLKRTVLLAGLMLPLALFGTTKDSATVTFDRTVMLNGTQIPAGHYRVQWEGSGTSVKASLIQGKKVVATAPATLVEGKTGYDEAYEVEDEGNSAGVLHTIQWRNRSLRFDQPDDSANPALDSTTIE
jgi:hypothetical protein